MTLSYWPDSLMECNITIYSHKCRYAVPKEAEEYIPGVLVHHPREVCGNGDDPLIFSLDPYESLSPSGLSG